MINNELHVIHNPHEAEEAEQVGLPLVNTSVPCANCAAPVGCEGDKFVPFAIVLNEETDWLLCMMCASPAIKPRN
jgi:hypothetical protein